MLRMTAESITLRSSGGQAFGSYTAGPKRGLGELAIPVWPRNGGPENERPPHAAGASAEPTCEVKAALSPRSSRSARCAVPPIHGQRRCGPANDPPAWPRGATAAVHTKAVMTTGIRCGGCQRGAQDGGKFAPPQRGSDVQADRRDAGMTFSRTKAIAASLRARPSSSMPVFFFPLRTARESPRAEQAPQHGGGLRSCCRFPFRKTDEVDIGGTLSSPVATAGELVLVHGRHCEVRGGPIESSGIDRNGLRTRPAAVMAAPDRWPLKFLFIVNRSYRQPDAVIAESTLRPAPRLHKELFCVRSACQTLNLTLAPCANFSRSEANRNLALEFSKR